MKLSDYDFRFRIPPLFLKKYSHSKSKYFQVHGSESWSDFYSESNSDSVSHPDSDLVSFSLSESQRDLDS